jgi:hypothetical protein
MHCLRNLISCVWRLVLNSKYSLLAVEGIRTSSTLDDVDQDPTDKQGQGSEIDENFEIFEMEKRDFDNENGIESDVC